MLAVEEDDGVAGGEKVFCGGGTTGACGEVVEEADAAELDIVEHQVRAE